MDALLEQARSVWEGQIDYEGQRLVDTLSTLLLSAAGFLAFVVGFVTQNIQNTLWIGLGGTALTFVVCVPPWPFYNRNPLQWLPARNAPVSSSSAAGDYGGYTRGQGLEGIEITVDGKKVQ
ncbi:hypothetical protein AAFC00_003487 [Neodothiora populina]|uniref:Signal peptidase complex subunit 1 n=1 Tax=Neodothiora populina TaxID=2781224 RepID=A0ABR3PEB4_9PEZI